LNAYASGDYSYQAIATLPFDPDRTATAQRCSLWRGAYVVRALAALLLAAIAFVPTIARGHDRLDPRTPAEQHSRFRWTNSCESVPQRTTTVVVVTPIEGPAQATAAPPRHVWRGRVDIDVPLPAVAPVHSRRALRAPPALLA
jgi:hypothetical protein